MHDLGLRPRSISTACISAITHQDITTVYLEIFAIRNFREAPPELKFPEFNFREGVQGSLFILFI